MHSMLVTFGIACLLISNASASESACQRPPSDSITVNDAATCDPKPLIYDHEGCKECMYLDTKGIKTIAVGFNLQRSDARAILASVGANYSAIFNGPVTPVKTPCDCNKVTCLNQAQISKIFDITVQGASRDAQGIVSTFGSLCCPVQNVMVDMSFTLGRTTFATFRDFIYWLTNQNWKASTDDLRTTKWCQVQARNRCNSDADTVQKGCGCTGLLTRQCDSVSSACCQEEQTCCRGKLTFKNYVTRTVQELLCCPYSDAVCCEENKCCQSQYPICCLPNYCCAAGSRCVGGQCFREDGSPGESVPATCKRMLA